MAGRPTDRANPTGDTRGAPLTLFLDSGFLLPAALLVALQMSQSPAGGPPMSITKAPNPPLSDCRTSSMALTAGMHMDAPPAGEVPSTGRASPEQQLVMAEQPAPRHDTHRPSEPAADAVRPSARIHACPVPVASQ